MQFRKDVIFRQANHGRKSVARHAYARVQCVNNQFFTARFHMLADSKFYGVASTGQYL